MTIFVGSLKYAPVYKSHCCAFGNICEENGYDVKYIFAKEYDWMLSEDMLTKTRFIGNSVDLFSMLRDTLNLNKRKELQKVFSESPPTHIYLHNYHLLNHYIAKLAQSYGCKFIYHVHEPFVENKKAHGGFQQFWLYFFEYLQKLLVNHTDIVIVSSNEASTLFDSHYRNFKGKKLLVPLLYEDLGNDELDSHDRSYITFVGPPVPAKNPEKFLEIVEYSKNNNLNLRFLLISRSPVNDVRFFKNDNLEVFNKKRISDKEYGELIQKSIAVITPYKRETQSSVVLVSYMYGTPVISSDIGGLPEFVNHEKTGFLLDPNTSTEIWIEVINKLINNFSEISTNCRNYFVNFFSEKNWIKYIHNLLN